jgi:MFS family permease
VSPGRERGDRSTFRSLRVRNYRLFAAGQVVSLSGTWAQRVAQDWLVLELSGGSGVALGLTTGLQFLPVLLFGLYAGLLADRYDKRRLLLGAQAAMAVLALLLAVLVLSGAVQLWHVMALALCLGLATAVDTPVRQSFVSEMVGPDDLPNAVSLNSATFNSARIVGPAVAGVAISAVGTGPVFLVNALTYAAVIGGLLAMRPQELHRTERVVRARGQAREGLAYVWSRPELLVPIALVGVLGMFALSLSITLALMATQVFGAGAGRYGALLAALAVGSLLGALVSARRSGPPRTRLLLGAVVAVGVLEIALAAAPTLQVLAVLLVPTGVAVLTFTTTANSTVQLASAPQVRGRVMALYILCFFGGMALGAPLVGAVAEVAGPRASLLLGGLVSLVSALVATVRLSRVHGVRVEPGLAGARPVLRVRPLPPSP